jgi:two-component system LytT family response regulator
LPRDSFERVHRRAVLNLDHVTRLEPLETGGFLAHVRGGQSIEVSRQAARELRRRLRLR